MLGLIFHRLVIEPDAGEALGQRLEHLLALDPRQLRAEAMVDARAERDVLVRPAGDVKRCPAGRTGWGRDWPRK